MKRTAPLLALLVLVATIASANDHRLKGRAAPEFELPDLAGKTIRLSDLRGKAVVLTFWATWCPPCRHEAPWFVELQKEHSEDLRIVGISMDEWGRLPVKDFAEKFGINYALAMAEPEVVRQYGVRGMPTTFFIDRDGTVIDVKTGIVKRDEIEAAIRAAIGESQKRGER